MLLSLQALYEAHCLMSGANVHALEADWRAMWHAVGRARLRSPDTAFLGWVRKQADAGSEQ